MNKNSEYKQSYEQQYETVESPDRIFSLLKPVIGKDASIKINPENTDDVFHTMLQDVDYDKKRLILKKINHTFGHVTVLDAQSITIYTQHNGAEVSFTASLSQQSKQDDEFYEIEFPKSVKYCQRRKSHRLHISFSMQLKASFPDNQRKEIEGHLRDISADGMRIQLSNVRSDEFQVNQLINNCVITLPNHEKITCTFEIRHIKKHVRNRGCTIGGLFYEMSAAQKREIQKFIASLERRALREIRL